MTKGRHRRALFGAVVALGLLGGCQLIVPSDVPDFRCAAADPSACPSGMTCDVATGRCVAPSGSPEGGDPDVALEEAGDASLDQDASTLADLGASCVVNAECKTGLCGTSTILTTAIVPTTSKPICTKTCCTSGDCAAGFVCFDGGTGGAYCVPAAKAQRTPPATGGKTPGTTCAASSECRSGFCDKPDAGPTGRCLDTCCKPGDCAAGSECRIKTVSTPAPGHDVWVCAAPEPGATKAGGVSCISNGECRSDACIPTGGGNCRSPCCGKASCVALGFSNGHCLYGTTGTEFFKFCLLTTTTSRLATGAPCTLDSECQTDYCDPELRKCLEVCCTDLDCPATQLCRPSAVNTPFLRCVAR